MNDHETSNATTRTSASGAEEPGVPLSTWLIGGAAFLVVLTAGALFLDAKPKEEPEEAQAEADQKEVQEKKDAPVQDLAPKNPLDITASYLDAQERARLWNPSAMLSGIELVVEDGKPKGAITFEFGETVGQAVPGAPLSAKRHSISYADKSVEEKSMDSPKRRVALPEPNCPLEVAFRTLKKSGVSVEGRVGVLYLESQKHGRPVWLATNESGQATSINADSCALLRR